MANRLVRRLGPALALLALLAAAGCGGSEPPSAQASRSAPPSTSEASPAVSASSSATPDPCALVTRPEAEQLAGTPLDEAQRDHDRCLYTGPVTGPSAQVEVFLGDSAQNLYEGDRQLGHTFATVAGIGDEAHIEDFAIFFSKSGLWVAIRLVRTDDWSKYRPKMEATARAAAARI